MPLRPPGTAHGTVGLDAFETAAVHDPEIRRLMTRVTMRVTDDGTRTGTGSAHSSVRVSLRDGRVLTRPATGARGHPDAPLPDAALQEKFETCAARVLEPARVSVLGEVLATLEGCPDIRTLTTLLEP